MYLFSFMLPIELIELIASHGDISTLKIFISIFNESSMKEIFTKKLQDYVTDVYLYSQYLLIDKTLYGLTRYFAPYDITEETWLEYYYTNPYHDYFEISNNLRINVNKDIRGTQINIPKAPYSFISPNCLVRYYKNGGGRLEDFYNEWDEPSHEILAPYPEHKFRLVGSHNYLGGKKKNKEKTSYAYVKEGTITPIYYFEDRALKTYKNEELSNLKIIKLLYYNSTFDELIIGFIDDLGFFYIYNVKENKIITKFDIVERRLIY